MKIRKSILAVTAVLIFSGVLSSCQKYEEGPSLSLRSKNARVSNDWKISYAFDIEDSEVITEKYSNETWTFTKNNEWIEKENDMIEKAGSWEFINDSKSIIITVSPSELKYYDILLLKENELWLKGEDKEIHFIPSEN